MRPAVIFLDSEDQLHEVPHGGLIGRLGTASLVLDDARISEAHAMVSLRGGKLKLLALRGRFAHGGQPCRELSLAVGQSIYLAQGLQLRVAELRIPESVLGLQIVDGSVAEKGQRRHILSGVTSLVRRPEPALISGYTPEALAHFWNHDDAWVVAVEQAAPQAVVEGDTIQVDGVELRVLSVTLGLAGENATQMKGAIGEPLEIFARYDSVQFCQGGIEKLLISGQQARLISELVCFGGPVAWEVLAREVWDQGDRYKLRRSLDQTLFRIRKKLESAHLRTTLVQAAGSGHIELSLQPGDAVHDLT